MVYCTAGGKKLAKMKQLLMLVLAVALTTMTPMLLVGGAVIKTADDADEDYAPLDLSHIDPVDLCLFICHSCFEQVRCHLLVSISGRVCSESGLIRLL